MDGSKIREARKRRKMTQGQLAEKLGLTTAAVSNYENQVSKPSVDMLKDISKALDVPLNFLLALESPEAEVDVRTDKEKRDQDKEMEFLEIIKNQQNTIGMQQESLSLLIKNMIKEQ